MKNDEKALNAEKLKQQEISIDELNLVNGGGIFDDFPRVNDNDYDGEAPDNIPGRV